MKILIVVHQFLPLHRGGTEIYTANLCRQLARDHEVILLYAEHNFSRRAHGLPVRPQGEVRQLSYEGFRCYEVTAYEAAPSLVTAYRDERMERVFSEILDRERPAVVHFQHLRHFSYGCPEIAKRAGCGVLFTLHEMELLCVRDGKMLRPNEERCARPVPELCAACAAAIFPSPTTDVRSVRGAASKTDAPGSTPDTAGVARRLVRRLPESVKGPIRRLVDGPGGVRARLVAWIRGAPSSGPAAARLFVDPIRKRMDYVSRALRAVDLVISPSAFLRGIVLDSGVIEDPQQIVVSDNGYDLDLFDPSPRGESAHVRFGFVGAVTHPKGVHVLVEGFARAENPDSTLVIRGDMTWFPDYAEELRRAIDKSGRSDRIRLLGAYDPDEVADVLAGFDVLVVPSIWYENSPLTIHEAYLMGIPVIASNIGGMKEYVEHGVEGLLFEVGDPQELARAMDRVAGDRDLLHVLQQGVRDNVGRRVKSIEQHARETVERYCQVVGVA